MGVVTVVFGSTFSGAVMSAVIGFDQAWYTVLVFVPPGLVTSGNPNCPGTCVWATAMASGVEEGEPLM